MSIALGTSLLLPNTSVLATANNKLTNAEIEKLKETFKFSDSYIEDLVEDGTVEEYLEMKKPKVNKKIEYYEVTKDKAGKAKKEKLSKEEFEKRLEKERRMTKKIKTVKITTERLNQWITMKMTIMTI